MPTSSPLRRIGSGLGQSRLPWASITFTRNTSMQMEYPLSMPPPNIEEDWAEGVQNGSTPTWKLTRQTGSIIKSTPARSYGHTTRTWRC